MLLDFRKSALNARKLGEALGASLSRARTSHDLKTARLEHLDASRENLRRLARRSAEDAALVDRLQRSVLTRERPVVSRRGVLAGAFGTLALSALPIPMVRAQIGGHNGFRIDVGKFGILWDGVAFFNDWSDVDTSFDTHDGARVGVLIFDSQFSWIEHSAMGGGWLSAEGGTVDDTHRNNIIKFNGQSNGLRRTLFLGSAAQPVRLWAQGSDGDAIGGRIINCILAHSWDGGLLARQTQGSGFTLNDIVGINNVIHDVASDPENTNLGADIFLRWDNNHGNWEDHFFWLNGCFDTGAEIRIIIEQGGSPGGMTINDAVTTYPDNFGGCFETSDPGFANYPGRKVYDNISDAFSDFATASSSPLRAAGRHLTTVSGAVNDSNILTMDDPTMFRSVAEPWGHPNYGLYGDAGGMGCYIEGVGYRRFVSHDPEGNTEIDGAAITVADGTRIWDLVEDCDIGIDQA